MTDDPTSRWTTDATVDSVAAGLSIPYLGPDPAPSRRTSIAFIAGCGVVAALHVTKAALYLHQAQLDRDLVASGGSSSSLARVVSASHTLSSLSQWGLLILLATVVAEVVWRRQRRPKDTLAQRGEAYVEFPILWVTPIALLVGLVGTLIVAFGLGLAGGTSATTAVTDLPHLRELQAASNVVWIVFWLGVVAWVLLLNRSHDYRVAWSGPYRADPSIVPFYPPVKGNGGLRGRGPRPRPGSPGTSRG